jgi:hypothetical protein
MPVGDTRWPLGNRQQPIVGPVAAPPLGMGGLPHQGRPAGSVAASDVWENFTLLPAAWSGGKAAVTFTHGPITVLELFVLGSDELYMSFRNSAVTSTPGSYELWHPGNGQLVEVVPHITQLWLATASGAAPANRVEIIGKGGLFGVPTGVLTYGP